MPSGKDVLQNTVFWRDTLPCAATRAVVASGVAFLITIRAPNCIRCKKETPASEFEWVGGWRGRRCRPCVLAASSAKIVSAKAGHVRRRLAQQYSLTPAAFDAMMTKQRGRCWICRKQPHKIRLCVDYFTNKGRRQVRGLLCRRCILLVGSRGGRAETPRRVLAYLKRFGAAPL